MSDALMEGIAIIGMAGRFPGADDVDSFWENLKNGVESISTFTDEELKAALVDEKLLAHPNYVKRGGVLEGADRFDADFFGYTPREAEITDPQQRLFLETAWAALEHAGYDAERYAGAVGVFGGAASNRHETMYLAANQDVVAAMGPLQALMGVSRDFLATRVSYKLNLTGPATTVLTACSTGLVAVHQACTSLLMYECDMALAGGVAVSLPQRQGYLYQDGGIMSPDGHCRTFDAQAKGTVPGEGVGVVILKRLEDALADGDTIHAVIKGTAINNDGALKVGYTAPSTDGQAKAIAQAQLMAGVEPDSIGYVEAHGTATVLGDPIEVAALTQVFRNKTDREGFCALGSVKSNIGHADAAAGVAGLIKTVMALKHRQLPPSLHFEKGNPGIPFETSPFYVNHTLQEWKAQGPRRAGVSSFGIGGTNAHVVLEEAPAVASAGQSADHHLLVLSAKTEGALERASANLQAHLSAHPEQALADVAYTLQNGRKEFSHRRFVVARDHQEAIQALAAEKAALAGTGVLAAGAEEIEPSVVFLFPGQGAQDVNMGRDLYQEEAVFRQHVDRGAELLQPALGLDLRGVLYPPHGEEASARELLKQTRLTQPALFVIEYALAQLWLSKGISPAAMIGHSIGEYVAACLAGVFSFEDALQLVAARGALMQDLPAGSMLAVIAAEAAIRELLPSDLSLAAVNGPNSCVVSGSKEAVAKFEQLLEGHQISSRQLETSHAFHSAMMDEILERFFERVSAVTLGAPELPYLSNVSGGWITAELACDPNYWVTHLREAVRFADGVKELLQSESRLYLEVGPGHALGKMVKQVATALQTKAETIVTLPPRSEELHDRATWLRALGQLWASGVAIDWNGLYGEGEARLRVPLPTYPFERKPYLLKPSLPGVTKRSLAKNRDVADWYYAPVWKQGFLSGEAIEEPKRWLVFQDDASFAKKVVERLTAAGHEVVSVVADDHLSRLEENLYGIDLRNRAEYGELFKELAQAGKSPERIVHFGSLTDQDESDTALERLEAAQEHGLHGLLYLAQAITDQGLAAPIDLTVITNNLQEVVGGELFAPERATLLGACKVIPQEYPAISVRTVDLHLPDRSAPLAEGCADLVAEELLCASGADNIAYRGQSRFVQTFEQLSLSKSVTRGRRLREGAVYLITGADADTGLYLADHLQQQVGAKLVLIGSAAGQELLQARFGDRSDILYLVADLTDLAEMQAAVAQAHAHFGAIDGAFHAVENRGMGMMQFKTPEVIHQAIDQKVRGALVLDAALQEFELELFVLFSSTFGQTGGLGALENAAASLFLDTLARTKTASGRRAFSLDFSIWKWETWQEEQMVGNPNVFAHMKQMREENGMTQSEGMAALTAVLNSSLSQVIISTQDLQAVLENQQAYTMGALAQGGADASLRKEGDADYVAPRNETEEKIAGILGELFGVGQVSVLDNFFELGGNSLLAIQLVARIRQEFMVELPMDEFFQAPTIAGLAERVSQTGLAQEELDELERLLGEIEDLDLEEVAARLNGDQ
ncbi:type I polyketide synthase [Tumebacillus lipolyticus]|uniref:SDR family NAD(P)-dependent oxidoreductase n=1 Tax=Tumebacillus lipolyticus TaxID=1280370 RepID=A0ABW4ZU77_9BACL